MTTHTGAGWHLAIDGATHGPYPTHEVEGFLKEGRITLDTPGWTDGMAEWVPLRQTAFASTPLPPPFPRATNQPPAASGASTPFAGLGGGQMSRPVFLVVNVVMLFVLVFALSSMTALSNLMAEAFAASALGFWIGKAIAKDRSRTWLVVAGFHALNLLGAFILAGVGRPRHNATMVVLGVVAAIATGAFLLLRQMDPSRPARWQ